MSQASLTDLQKAGIAPRRHRVLVLATHVVQYASPLFRVLANDPRLDLLVAYCSLQGAEPGLDPEFGVEVQWDVPLLGGYRWVHVRNRCWRPGLGRFWGLFNPGLWNLVRNRGLDVVMMYTGYMCASFWITWLAAKSKGIPVVISTDSTTVQSRKGSRWKNWIKPFVLGRVFSAVDVIMAASTAAKKLALELGADGRAVQVVRCGMDKDSWLATGRNTERVAVRQGWGIPAEAPTVLYCAKLQAWKRPLDLLRAFRQAEVPDAYLVFVGDGPQRQQLEAEAQRIGIGERVRFLGFVNVSQLPGLYGAADVFVLPSEYDPCPLVVPEAMFSGLPVILSDAVQGRADMIHEGISGYLYPCGNQDVLAALLRRILVDRELLQTLKDGVARQMQSWTREEFLDDWIGAIETAVDLKQNQRQQR